VKFNLNIQEKGNLLRGPEVGDVFQAKGGKTPRVYVIIGQRELSSYYVSLDSKGEICGVGNYYTSVFEERQRIGRVEGLEDLQFDINWD